MTSRETPNASGYPDFLLVLRAFAGMTVVAIHVYGSMIATPAQNESLWTLGPVSLTWLLSGAGQFGVFVFFTLSGYLMGKGFAKRRYALDAAGALRFYWSRILRIYPVLIFYMIVMITLGRMNAPTGTATFAILGQMLLMQWHPAFGDSFPWFKHLWSIMTEFQFYLTVPFFAFAFARLVRGRRAALLTLGALALAGFVARASVWHAIAPATAPWPLVGAQWDSRIQQPLVMNLDLFLGGMLLNALVVPKATSLVRGRVYGFFGLLLAAYVPAAWVTHYALFTPLGFARDLWALALPTASLAFAAWAIVAAEHLNAGVLPAGERPHALGLVRACAHLGTLTYGIYVWHLPFIALPIPFSRPFPPLPNLVVTMLLTYGLATLMAQVTHDGVEVPFARLKRLPTLFVRGRRGYERVSSA
jgi:peptidoglycan/LPS O-acetylase OafA/YrhL